MQHGTYSDKIFTGIFARILRDNFLLLMRRKRADKILTLVLLNIFYVLHSSPNFILLSCSIPVVRMHFQSEWKTVWILIRRLHQNMGRSVVHKIFGKTRVNDLKLLLYGKYSYILQPDIFMSASFYYTRDSINTQYLQST